MDKRQKKEEPTTFKRTLKKLTIKRFLVGVAVISLVSAGVALVLSQAESPSSWLSAFNQSVTQTGKTEDTWAIETLNEKEEMTYSMVDGGILEIESEMNAWAEENRTTEGVHAWSTDDHTYVLVSGGKRGKERLNIQLFDVRADKQMVYVGYDFIPQAADADKEEVRIPIMLIRLDKTEKEIVGRLITQP